MTRNRSLGLRLALVLALPLLLAHGDGGCGGEDDDGAIEFGPPTGAVCPDGGTELTYANFGAPFFETYCQRCHSADVTGADRQGAPADHNFDSQFEALAFKDHIDRMAGAGPDAVNEQMPIGQPVPTLEERQQLSEWLACDAPE